MKNFRDFLNEEVLPTVQVADGGLDISKPAVRAAINAAIAGVVSQPAVTPYVVFNRLSKLLAQYHIVLPKRFLEGDKGVEVFELRQFGHKMGMTDSGEFVNEVPSTHYLFLQYGIITPFGITYAKPVVGGMFKVMARVVDKEELDKLMDMAEITMAEEAECMQAMHKANAPKEEMKDITSDEKKKGNKEAVGASEKKSLDEEERPNAWGQYPKEAKQIRKQLRQEKKAKAFAKAQAKTVKEDEDLDEANKLNKEKKRNVEASIGASYKKMGFDGRGSKGRHPENKRHDDIGLGRKVMKLGEEDKDPCWKGYEMIGMKKKGSRKVPNCVPVKEEEQIDELYGKGSLGDIKGHHEKEAEKASKKSRAFGYAYTTTARTAKERGNIRAKLASSERKSEFHQSQSGRATRLMKHTMKEEQIDEVSKRLLGRYIKKAHVSGLGAAAEGEQAYTNKDKEALHRSNKTGEKREQGIERAVNKMTGSARVPANEAYEKQEAGVKTKDGKTHTLHRRNPGHPTEYHTVTTKDAEGKTSVKVGKPKYIKKHWDKLEEKAPPGREKQVLALKKKFPKGSESPFAIAWSSYNKSKGE